MLMSAICCYILLANALLSGPSSARQDAESEKEVWEGVRHESFVKMAGEDSASLPPVPYASPRTGLSSVHSGTVPPPTLRSSPERSKSDLRMAPKTPLSSLKRSHSTPMSLEGSTEGASRSRSRPTSEVPIPHRPLLDQLNQIEGETEMIREQTEMSLSHATDIESDGTKLQMQTEEIVEEPTEGQGDEVDEQVEGQKDKVIEPETEGQREEEEKGESQVEVKYDLDLKDKDQEEPETEPKEEDKEEIVEEREATPDEPPREATPASPVQSETDGQGRGTPNECSVNLEN